MKLLVLPGLDGNGALHDQFVAGFDPAAINVEVVRYPTELTRYSDLVDWMSLRLPDEDFTIVAESFSGAIAISIAAAKPSHLRGIAFVATFASSPMKLPKQFAELLRILPMKSQTLLKIAQPLLMGRWSTETFFVKFHEVMQNLPRDTIINRVKQVLQIDLAAKIKEIEVPYVYLSASQDRLIPKSAMDQFQLDPSQVIHLEGTHFVLQANPQYAAKAISEFVSSLEAENQ